MSTVDDICVVTHPIGSASGTHTEQLFEVLSSITNVSLVALWISDESALYDQYESERISETPLGTSLLVAAVQYVFNQFRLVRTLRRRQESTVLFFGTTLYVLPILYARLSGRTVILEPRGNVPQSLYQDWRRHQPAAVASLLKSLLWSVERVGYRLATGIITLSPGTAADLGLERYSHKLYPDGMWHIDVESFTVAVPYADRGLCVGYVGRLSEEKGIRELVPIVRALPSHITFVFVGDGELREWVEMELAEEIEAGQVEVTGWVDHDDLPSQFNRFKLTVMTSRTEGLPVTLLESMACGTPVCASPVAGIPDIVREDETGYLLESTDSITAADEIASILADDPAAMSASCRSFVEKTYSKNAAIERYRTALTTLAG